MSKTWKRRLSALEIALGIAEREAEIGIDAADRIAETKAALEHAQGELDAANARWEAEKTLVEEVLDLRAKLRQAGEPLDESESAEDEPQNEAEDDLAPPEPAVMTEEERAEALSALRDAMARLAEAQGERPLILPSVDRNAIAAVVQDWTGIPTGRMLASQTERALGLAETLAERVARTGSRDEYDRQSPANRGRQSERHPRNRRASFLLCGPSGVGKTETALALAETLVRWRAEPDFDQHERIPGSAHSLNTEGSTARLCRLRQGRAS